MPKNNERLPDLLGCTNDELEQIQVILTKEDYETLKPKYRDDLKGVNDDYPRELSSDIRCIVSRLRTALKRLRNGENLFAPKSGRIKARNPISAVAMSNLSQDDLFQQIPDDIHRGAIRFLTQDIMKVLKTEYGENIERLRSRFPKEVELTIINVCNFYKEAFQNLQRRTNKPVQVEENPTSEQIIVKVPIKEKPTRSELAKALGNAKRYLESRKLNLNGFTVRLINTVLDKFDFETQIVIIRHIEEILASYSSTLSKMVNSNLETHFRLKKDIYAGSLEEAIEFFSKRIVEVQEKPSVTETIVVPTTDHVNPQTTASLISTPVAQAGEVKQKRSIEEAATKSKLRIKDDPLANEMMLAMNTAEKGTIVKLYFGIGEGLNPLTTEEVVKKMNSSGKNKVTLTRVQQTILGFIDDYKKRNQAICDTIKNTLKAN